MTRLHTYHMGKCQACKKRKAVSLRPAKGIGTVIERRGVSGRKETMVISSSWFTVRFNLCDDCSKKWGREDLHDDY